MQSLTRRSVVGALILVWTGILAAGASAVTRQLRLPGDYGAWSRVAMCESGGWQVLGYTYPDSLGINRSNWLAAGGRPLPAGPVSRANRITEIRVADRFVARYHTAIPDQYGCGAW
jgi:hypothetical protein